jgi:hypothetical protein
MTVADIAVFSALVLIAHGLPIEQKIISSPPSNCSWASPMVADC